MLLADFLLGLVAGFALAIGWNNSRRITRIERRLNGGSPEEMEP